MHISHPIPPVYNTESRILILGSFPSVKSREVAFFYGHTQNRFWRVLAVLFDEEVPENTALRRDFLLRHKIAVWDTIASCDITGSSDASVKNAHPNDLTPILTTAPIRAIFCNGALSYKLFQRHIGRDCPVKAFPLPSTSPANAAKSLNALAEEWRVILSYLT